MSHWTDELSPRALDLLGRLDADLLRMEPAAAAASLNERALLRIHGVGRKAVQEIQRALAAHGTAMSGNAERYEHLRQYVPPRQRARPCPYAAALAAAGQRLREADLSDTARRLGEDPVGVLPEALQTLATAARTDAREEIAAALDALCALRLALRCPS